ncbi:olfactomedin-like [Rhinatrema bivittatum]|uniref:olfactomedin-like n=1 Tax=Rhinatrema bivittatum TaxID=194408 RepID=UPI0011286955|nr:olfactomedin-like [Rhinatrema bivittatum]
MWNTDEMFHLLLIALVLLQVAALSVTKTVPGVVNKKDQCVCNVVLPENIFPAQKLEALEKTAHSLNTSVLQEMNKLQEYENSLKMIKEKLENLTLKVDQMNVPTEVLLSEVDFNLLKAEVKLMETFVHDLQTSVNGSNSNVDNLYNEVQNISNTVNQLETFDKNNVLTARREIDSLRKRLDDCKRNSGNVDKEMHSYGVCDHKGIASIGKPSVVQLNWRGVAHRHGAWGKDSSMKKSTKKKYWVTPLEADGRLLDMFRVYNSSDDLLLYKNSDEKQLSVLDKSTNRWNHTNSGQGGGMIMYDNSLYYNCYNSRDICKFNLETNKVARKALTNAAYNNRFSYAGVSFQDMDFAADEKGFWVTYSAEKNSGNIMIGKMNATSLSIERIWITSQYKPGVTNTFMVCGVLYATRPLNTRKEEIFYMFDTKTGKEGRISIKMDKLTETVDSINYDPNSQKIHLFSEGYLMSSDVYFKH